MVIRVGTMEPKKPCSGNYGYARVRLTNGIEVTCHVEGDGQMATIREHHVVLVKGGGQKQMPGVKYSLVCGALDLKGGAPHNTKNVNGNTVRRNQSRSKYGVKRKK